ncbi:indole-3-glycerol phosphate synthase TrpC [Marinicella sp. S1101]|uniref:indole-3-glycerol phosphate synthase TrpC n=1 Tax=Marinicella marina TaxID=2996016 RepID=UPI002260A1CC|nr:indole-3-glycerol phosphate synthase TrpC [Marinicella marina]MCX7555122.1 indole-3-glycerol phosphate synthase TrpC [Marinicella marina]MDJ1140331.1 indole-3-glycerol phosphate synthase TrpC [Marinicella marina]
MSNILDQIIATKHDEVAAGKTQQSISDFRKAIEKQTSCRGFYHAIENQLIKGETAVIAEVKKASPSKGIIRADFDPVAIAQSYLKGGATCLSVLTDQQYFKGSNDYLLAVRQEVGLPVLRKDFMVDAWQIYQSRALGADCVLLIVACLDDEKLHELHDLAIDLGMDVLVEVHDEVEMQRALNTPARLIGINNRNLKTFETSLTTSEALVQMVDEDRIVVSESGIHFSPDIEFLQQHDINTYLIGESFMRHADPGIQLKRLMNGEVSP